MNSTLAVILEIAKYVIPSVVVVIGTSVIVKRFLITETERKRLAIFHEGMSKTMMLRLQAYERLSIFVERIHPRSLISRLYQGGMTNAQLQLVMIQNIQAEYEHNLSQQIYVSTEVWRTISSVKEQEMAMVNTIGAQLNPDGPAKELTMRIMDYLVTVETVTPVEIALEMINNEAKLILSMSGK